MENDSPPISVPCVVRASRPDVTRLASLLRAHTPHDGSFELCIPGVHAIRVSRPSAELVHGLHRPALCIIAQGAKSVMLGEEGYEYDASRMLIFSVDLPIAAQVRQASHSKPYLCLRLDLDPHRIAELVTKVYPDGIPRVQNSRAVYLAQASEAIVDAAARLIELMVQPLEANLLAPLVVDEILIRLLRSAVGGRLAQIGHPESNVHRIAKAVSWVRDNYTEPMRVEDLAELVHMSASSFHQHFKSVTSMSPLQYQKVLRLNEARRLMISTDMDAGLASRRVGYLSPSQFSREYARFFGIAPTKDVCRLRDAGLAEVSFTQ
jgi:AraC-like DNA-binding protein